MKNRQVRLGVRPTEIPQAEHFDIVDEVVPDIATDQVLVRNIFLSVDPAMRGWIVDAGGYSDPVEIGSVMRAFASGRVEASRHANFKKGDLVTGMFGWQDYAVVDGAAIERKISKSDLPLSTSLGILRLNGVTAYFGFLEVGQPVRGETVVVRPWWCRLRPVRWALVSGRLQSSTDVGQSASRGGERKTKLCREEFGYDAAIDYKSDGLDAALASVCPDGIDVYFDNTAGPISDSVMAYLNVGARIVVCGTASISSWNPAPQGPRVQRHLLVKRARLQGFVVFDVAQRYGEARQKLAQWVRDCAIRYREDILDGIEHAPGAIAGLYRGDNAGKRLIRIAPESH